MPKRSRADDEENDNPSRSADKATWTRIMNRRRQDLKELKAETVNSILAKVPKPPNSRFSVEGTSPVDQLEDILWDHMEIAGDSTRRAPQRRQSLDAITKTLAEVDKEIKRKSLHQDPQSTVATSRSVLDRVDLSATSSTVPLGSVPAPDLNGGVGATFAQSQNATAHPEKPVHPIMRQSSASVANPFAVTTTVSATTEKPIHPAILDRLPSTSSSAAPQVAEGTSTATSVNPPALQNSATNTSGSSTMTASTTVTTAGPSGTNNSSAQVNSTGTTTAESAPVHSAMRNSDNGSSPVPPSMQRSSSSTGGIVNATAALNAAAARTNTTTSAVTSTSTSTARSLPSHPIMQASSTSTGIAPTVTGGTIPAASVSTLPVHPSMQGNSSSTGTATIATGTSADTASATAAPGTLPVHPSMQGSSIWNRIAGTAASAIRATTGSAAGNLPVHHSMQANSSATTTATVTTTAPGASIASGSGNLPVHSSMQGNSSSAGGFFSFATFASSNATSNQSSVGATAGAATAATPTANGSFTSVDQRTAPSATTTGTVAVNNAAAPNASDNLPPQPPNSGSTSTPSQHKTATNGQNSSSSKVNDKASQAATSAMHTNGSSSQTANRNSGVTSSSNGQSSASTPTSTATAANPSASGQTGDPNSTPSDKQKTSSTSTTVTSQGGSSSSGQNPPQQSSRPADTSTQVVTSTSANSNASRTNQPTAASSQSPAPSMLTTATVAKANVNEASGTNQSQAAAGVTSAASTVGQNGTLQKEADDKAKENRKPPVQQSKKPSIMQDPTEIKYAKSSKIKFPADPGNAGHSGCFFPRQACTVTCKKITGVPVDLLHGVASRFSKWEPYWSLNNGLMSGLTCNVDEVEWPLNYEGSENTPKSVWTANISDKTFTHIVDKIPKWGEKMKEAPKDGEYRLLLRMLPLKVSDKMKKKRADCHIWPKGTLLLVNGKPQNLIQRKQQSHNKEEWKNMCEPLDLSSVIALPLTKHTIQLCSVDEEQYVVSLALCQYRSPRHLFRKITGEEPECKSKPHHALKRLSLEQTLENAKERINQQAIFLDDDDGNTETKEESVGKFVFSLIDPINKQAIVTPVRGNNCKHWQCFDLNSFLQTNVAVSGSRWRCPCCEQFLSYSELQHCALTQAALDKFRDQVTSNRGRVEFRSDETYELLPADRLRHSKPRRNTNGSNNSNPSRVQPKQAPDEQQPRPAQQEVEIIVID